MYVMYYASMLQCWQLVMILVKTNHPCLRVGRHNFKDDSRMFDVPLSKLCGIDEAPTVLWVKLPSLP
jgi:hypothetical protein